MGNTDHKDFYRRLKKLGKLTPGQEEIIKRELEEKEEPSCEVVIPALAEIFPGLYDKNDFEVLMQMTVHEIEALSSLKTLDELLEHDKQREKDGFPRRIRIGRLIKPSKDDKGKVIIVPTTTEPKFYHDESVKEEEEDSTGGTGDGEEGDVIGEQQVQPKQGEGEGQGSGEGEGAEHDISSDAFDLGKVLTEQFQLPNLKNKGTKRSFTKYTYELTDKNRGFGQVLDKKATLKKIIETNILLGRIKQDEEFSGEDLLLSPQDYIYRILSKEKDFEAQAIVFFLRDYSGSMEGKPTEVVSTLHLLIYSWLMYQYKNNVETRFIVHDTLAKEVPDFYTYYKSKVAGGTRVAPAFELVNNIVDEEQLAKDYNIYVFHGTDGDDWDNEGTELIEAIRKMLMYAGRIGITVAKNAWGVKKDSTTVEKNINKSGLLIERPDLIRMDSFVADEATESRIVEGIKKLID